MKWEAKIIHYNGETRIAVYFENNADWTARMRAAEGSRWRPSTGSGTASTGSGTGYWHLPDTEENRNRFKIAPASESLPSQEGAAQLEVFEKWLRSKRYSANTIKTYSEALKSFFVFYRGKSIREMDNDDVIHYNNEYILKNKLSASYQNQIVNSLKLYFRTIQEKRMEVEKIHRLGFDRLSHQKQRFCRMY